jgi:hypothetical protein
MPPLESLSLGKRIGLAAVIVVVTFFVLLIISRWAEAQQKPPPEQQSILYENIPFDPALLTLDRRALDEAYHQQMLKLFGVWLASGAPEDARNFKNGLNIARRAFGQARDQIRKREETLNALDPNGPHTQDQEKRP